MPTVLIPPPYRGPTDGAAEIVVEGDSVLACLEAVGRKYPGFLDQVLTADGAVHRFVKLFQNGEQLDGDVLSVAVSEDDSIEILAAIAGG
ncbi:MAG: MoaD/ThiS family protein [Myxococcota bacterium]|nr:MoaD/ThiS family protein [Myxococcota bacterium]